MLSQISIAINPGPAYFVLVLPQGPGLLPQDSLHVLEHLPYIHEVFAYLVLFRPSLR